MRGIREFSWRITHECRDVFHFNEMNTTAGTMIGRLRSKDLLRSLAVALVVALASGPSFSPAHAEATSRDAPPAEASAPASARAEGATQFLVRTESPRETMASFMRLRDALEAAVAAYRQDSSREAAQRVSLVATQMGTLYDFSQIPAASRKDLGSDTAAYVLDILGRVRLPRLDEIPDLATVEEKGLDYYAIPETPLRLVRMDDGARTGQFLFSAHTVEAAPWFYRGVEQLPLRSSLPISSWIEESRQLTGPMIPAALVDAIPEGLKPSLLGTPAWKVLVVAALALFAAGILVALRRVTRHGRRASRHAVLWRRLCQPLAVVAVTMLVEDFAAHQLNVAGAFALALDTVLNAVLYLALAWAVWLAALAGFEMLIGGRDASSKDIDANMLRLVARIVGVVCVIAVLATGAQAMGVPVISVLAGLGVGGLAVALAIRPTLENLIGGMILYLDKPIRVGDFCSFGSQNGVVENIGVRSTLIRARDRTLISIPNAQFADMPIVNWTQCDQMLIEETIGLRYDTGGDQLRHVLEKLREMLCGHPSIDPETVTVHFAGYGSSSLDVSIRVYARTLDWNEFLAIKEEVLFRVKDVVEGSGTGFALPSQTLYLGRDKGPDPELTDRANSEVASWRRSGRLHVPRLAAAAIERLAGRTGHPQPASPDHHVAEAERPAGGERSATASLEQEAGGADKALHHGPRDER
ncbi:mechanosensitive ion channel family protein [Limibaculum sp. FT325]|uniref:mechanosensitive ion channel family protein n=1 Tax=Thermohalobaculum sediminis TaxID=2939436 RepID=UPI0020C17C6D|nr:mechanosensitive ion channel family protein [Limibaculum sediminis]MCL5776907.1 mechanosensitive ion channel family protein [Limibaculum sediminis]